MSNCRRAYVLLDGAPALVAVEGQHARDVVPDVRVMAARRQAHECGRQCAARLQFLADANVEVVVVDVGQAVAR